MKKITKKQNKDFVTKACQMLLRIGCKSFKDEHTSHIRFTLETTVGILRISVDTDNLCCYTIYSRFEEVKKAREKVDCNCFSGKYNLHTGGKESNLNSIICEFENFFNIVLPPKNEEKTKVKFLVNETQEMFKEDVFAFFPEEIHNGEFKTSYSHIGQHSACCDEYANESRNATKKEREDLQNELENIVGYNLEILN